MRKAMNLTGQKFTRLTALKITGVKNHSVYWLCQCDCGNQKVVSAKTLRSGHAKSCGCLNREMSALRVVSMNTTHNQSGTRLYEIWTGIKKRCNNPNAKNYENYGGRGIKLCEEWNDFEPFYKWAIKAGYSDALSIDRINNDGDYEPTNCRWATDKVQCRNRRSSRRFEFNGKSMTLGEWAEARGINQKTLSSRIYYCGWDIEKALTTL